MYYTNTWHHRFILYFGCPDERCGFFAHMFKFLYWTRTHASIDTYTQWIDWIMRAHFLDENSTFWLETFDNFVCEWVSCRYHIFRPASKSSMEMCSIRYAYTHTHSRTRLNIMKSNCLNFFFRASCHHQLLPRISRIFIFVSFVSRIGTCSTTSIIITTHHPMMNEIMIIEVSMCLCTSLCVY